MVPFQRLRSGDRDQRTQDISAWFDHLFWHELEPMYCLGQRPGRNLGLKYYRKIIAPKYYRKKYYSIIQVFYYSIVGL